MSANTQTNKQTLLETSSALCYAMMMGKYSTLLFRLPDDIQKCYILPLLFLFRYTKGRP